MNKIALMGAGFFGSALHSLEKESERGLTINEPTPYIMPTTHPLSGVKVVKEKNKSAYKPYNTPPRSMTPEELAYYKIHKTLKGFTND